MLPPYQSPSGATMADLLAASYRARAQAERIGGEASANLWGGLAHQTSQTLRGILRYEQDEPRREKAELDLEASIVIHRLRSASIEGRR
jgi:hypothetical protein